eukprot:TRINITY_DN4688_c0_g2_i1.p1 TRINITY_DN4688_c0_g2~~TRINITY_DN4688_c0_g2_i1.p1  ORF type:complete len:151 (+),score=27.11 TRINITY_DN4688_c0_g2_i1:87-539(+)
MEKLGNSFITKDGQTDGAYLKDMKYVFLYFGAKYCKPCQKFTQQLLKFYSEINSKEEKIVEIVYLGFDQKGTFFKEGFSEMPWIAYEFKDEKKVKIYSDYKEQIKGIPCLIILNPENGQVVTNQGRGMIEKMDTETTSIIYDKLNQLKMK